VHDQLQSSRKTSRSEEETQGFEIEELILHPPVAKRLRRMGIPHPTGHRRDFILPEQI
jgi:hypothetical protein